SKKCMSEDILHIDANELKKITFTGNLGGEHKNITLPDFGLNINIGDSSIFELSDIAKIYRYSPMLRFFEIPKGYIKIQTKDFETFAINGEVEDLKYPLYDKTGKKLSHYVLEGVINPKGIFIGSQDKKFRFIKEGNIVKLILDGYNLRIDEVFSSSVPLLAQINQENEVKESLTPEQRQEQEAFLRAKQSYEQKNNISPHITYVEAANMDFYLQDYMIPSDFASIAIRDGVIRADITYGNGVANVDMAYSQANLRLSNFSDKFLNQVWQRDIFSGGLFNFKGVYNDGALKGQISVQNTTYNDLSIVQNILALIDTIPALLTFRKPGLGANGYEIKKGTIDFMINNEFLVLENIDLVGSSIDVEGGGLVKLNTKELDVVLKASTLKRLADIIDKIPLFDYVILGDDGKFATGIVMKGTLDNPKSEVSVAEDILFSPFEMVGRILKPVDNFLGNLSNALESGVESLPVPEKERSINIPDTPMEPEQDSQKIDTQQPALEEKELDSLLNEPNLPQEEEE
ncbi:AsmA-like C-terminal domain-containing protein, partial [uncultured Helicobacter sp.]|uniref:YhdP family protein n=1 Tax=uncultured Helicobacter sp. TaxID=175537 RepID=UPI00262E7C05